ncbi:MAG: hypothetical protein M3295_03040 [Chloroflexota bacterium]|nr:hypothetical protein [Chloroflexota bacterium]
MTANRDPDRLIHRFLLEGEEELHDQVYDAVRAEIERKRQRAFIGPWRTDTVNRFLALGIGAAAVVVIALLVGSRFLGSTNTNVGGPGVEPTPTPEASLATPSAEPTTVAGGFLPEGPFLVRDVGALADAPRITVTIPGPGWTSLPDVGGLQKGPGEDPPQSAMLLWAWPAGTTFQVFGDPCHWATARRTDTSTVDELAAALAAQPSRDASDPVDVTVGGYAGKHVTLHVPEDWDASSNDCDQENFASYGVNGGDPARYHQGPGQIDEFWILDVDGEFAILDAMYRPDTPAELVEEMRGIAQSATFELP